MGSVQKGRNYVLANALPIQLWPRSPDEVIEEDKREVYARNCKAMEMYVEGEPVDSIVQATGIHRTQFSQMLQRCLTLDKYGNIFGFNALIPGRRIKEYERSVENYEKFHEAQGGLSGSFKQVLKKYPWIEQRLVDLILKNATTRNTVNEHRIMAGNVHREFIKILKGLDIKAPCWPFNTKNLGIITLRKFVQEVLDQNFAKGVARREGQASKAHLSVGTSKESLIHFTEPYDAVELDAYRIDAFFTSTFETPEGLMVDAQLDRLWLIAMVDVVSQAILAYKVVYRSEVNTESVVDVIRNALQVPERLEITIDGIEYPSDGGFPSEVIPELRGSIWSIIKLDNALVHLAKHIHQETRKSLGFSINWGIPGHFERRPNIERLFGGIAQSIFFRYPSTTGSDPKNGRAKDAEGNAVKYKLRVEEAEQLLAVRIAQYNAEPSHRNHYKSPLEVLRHFVENDKNFEPRRLPTSMLARGYILPIIKICVVRGNRVKGRRPYIEFAKVRYTSPDLSSMSSLIGKKLKIEIEKNNVQYVRAYLPDGTELGLLKAMGKWGYTVHSLDTRQKINRLSYKRILVCTEHTDVIMAYMEYVSKRLKESKRKNRQLSPKAATEAVRVANEAGLPRKITDPSKVLIKNEMQIHRRAVERPHIMPGPSPDIRKLLKKNR